MFWRQIMVVVAQQDECTELCTEKMVKIEFMVCIFYHT